MPDTPDKRLTPAKKQLRRRLMRPLLIVISAPSGTGKTTLCDRLLLDYPEITYSVSCTTRLPRGQEEDGIDYFFVTENEFKEKVAAGQFLEHAMVHGNLYGTLREPVESAMLEGQSILMHIDVAGAAQIRDFVKTLQPTNILRAGFVDIFIKPPNIATLQARLEGRDEDSPAAIELRLKNAITEMAHADDFAHKIINDHLETAVRELLDIIEWAGRRR